MSWKLFKILVIILFSLFLVRFGYDYTQISNYQATSINPTTRATCGIVLTGGPGRIQEGVQLLAQGVVQKLIISGVSPKASSEEIMSSVPFYSSSLEKFILLEKRSTTTYGNAQQTLPIVEAWGCQDLLLVTSKTHMYRALQVFRAIYPPEFSIISHATQSSRNESWSDLSTEVLKSIFYSLWVY